MFDLPYDEERYQKTLEVCALLSDLKILEDGDMSEIGERGVSPCALVLQRVLTEYLGEFVWRPKSTRYIHRCSAFGQRFSHSFTVSLARAVYSRASVLLLDDVLSAGEFLRLTC